MSEKIEEGEYIRTIYGEIFKVFRTTKQNKKYIFVDREVDRHQDRDVNDSVLEIKEIVKHSKNIIDVIEVGDYVNGYYVEKVWEQVNYRMAIDLRGSYLGLSDDKFIETIVTKEQYKEMEYRV